MRKDIHPEYRFVIFRDTSCGQDFRIRSTCKTEQTIVWEDGETYPLVNVDVSSSSHPVYTGKQREVASEGRIARFNKRFGERTKPLAKTAS